MRKEKQTETATPGQFETMFSRNSPLPDSPEKRLVCTVLRQAVEDAQKTPAKVVRFNKKAAKTNLVVDRYNAEVEANRAEEIAAREAAIKLNEEIARKNELLCQANELLEQAGRVPVRLIRLKPVPELTPLRTRTEPIEVHTQEPVMFFTEGRAGELAGTIGLDADFVLDMFVKHSGIKEYLPQKTVGAE